jgi:hypothetical protein
VKRSTTEVRFERLPRAVSSVLSRTVARMVEEGRSAGDMSVVVSHLRLGEHWTVVDGLWQGMPDSITRMGREYWRPRLSITGGIGRSPGESRSIDVGEVAAWARDLDSALASLSLEASNNGITASNTISANASNVSVHASRGAMVSVGGVARPLDPPTRRGSTMGLRAWIGWIAGVLGGAATILTLVFYVIDRAPN